MDFLTPDSDWISEYELNGMLLLLAHTCETTFQIFVDLSTVDVALYSEDLWIL